MFVGLREHKPDAGIGRQYLRNFRKILNAVILNPEACGVVAHQHHFRITRIGATENLLIGHHRATGLPQNADKVDVTGDFAVAVIGHRHKLNVPAAPLLEPPIVDAPEELVGVCAGAFRKFALESDFMTRMIGLTDPEHRHVGQVLYAVIELITKQNVEHLRLRGKVRERKRHRGRTVLQQTIAFIDRNGFLQRMNTGVQVPRITISVHILKASAAGRIGTQYAHGLTFLSKKFSHIRHGIEPFGTRFVLSDHTLSIPTAEKLRLALKFRAIEAVGDQPVTVGAKPRKDHGMVNVRFGGKARQIVFPGVAFIAKTREVGHHIGRNVTGTQAVEAHQ